MPSELPVLVLETDTPLQGLLKAVLRRDGYAPQFVRDGRAAVRLLSRRFAAIIVDVSIAPSSLESGSRRGLGFIHYLQQNAPDRLPHVVVLTGLSERELPAEVFAVSSVLRKPFDLDALRGAIARCTAITVA